ncbi:MAG: TetR/AcrR family transcriptional regulator [Oscillospiraceae bacterium]|nr:TetR/AcrR family transcriptional regulator [Candidatus Ruminococcus equi]
MENTKEKILDAALISFAENGYKGTNLRDLAGSLGLSKSALYKHYKSKEDIYNAVLDRMEAYYIANFDSADNAPFTPKSTDELLSMTMEMLDFTMHDKKIILTRQLLLTEQFRDQRTRRLATLHFLTGTRDNFAKIFAEMIKLGILKDEDPDMLSFAYTSPITTLLHYCDREPKKEEEIIGQIEEFIRHFIKTYSNK